MDSGMRQDLVLLPTLPLTWMFTSTDANCRDASTARPHSAGGVLFYGRPAESSYLFALARAGESTRSENSVKRVS